MHQVMSGAISTMQSIHLTLKSSQPHAATSQLDQAASLLLNEQLLDCLSTLCSICCRVTKVFRGGSLDL